MLQVQQGDWIPNRYPKMTASQQHDAMLAIDAIDFADVWRDSGSISKRGEMRVDVQGRAGSQQQNLQVQLNDIKGNSTVACALVADSVGETSIEAQQVYALRKVKNALFSSLNDGHIYSVSGSPT
ncbi:MULTISPECIES: hypothetical protein [unclassified Halomonas]|uniref:hypothetical protein n=1 Tax=unclassified Halomonas TaxID=2609666 RepID=UPI0006DA4A71|nr:MULTISPECIES: hypothetical protein [unclassified Halomonas]KPQ20802.1 MAG: hypothetical protein HLUCCO06_00530 [Halomonas sp. HL-93]SBR51268.1 hypothetical protein GA0071314_3101 [Halomonas sp. HL-93]SNY97262.1 hypothetical protein SAMN04488142_1840 [Halomonas sp. hl-4]